MGFTALNKGTVLLNITIEVCNNEPIHSITSYDVGFMIVSMCSN